MQRVKWKCSLGHEWLTTLNSRTNSSRKGTDCPFCSENIILAGFNDAVTTSPLLARKAVDRDPTKFTQGSLKISKWRCEKVLEWAATVNSRADSLGCPSCSTTGFNPNEVGWLYFLSHPHRKMLQIGMANFPIDRMTRHRKLGWEAIVVMGLTDGLLTRN